MTPLTPSGTRTSVRRRSLRLPAPTLTLDYTASHEDTTIKGTPLIFKHPSNDQQKTESTQGQSQRKGPTGKREWLDVLYSQIIIDRFFVRL